MTIRPYRQIIRRQCRQIHVGSVPVGGDAPITVQSMTNTPTGDAGATIDQIRDYLRQRFPALRNRQIDDRDRLLEGGIIDSLAVLDLVAYLETQFNITLADDDLVPETFQSLASLAAFVEAKARSAPAPS